MSTDNYFASAINKMISIAVERDPKSDEDYIGEGGLLYCGKCHTPRQCIHKWFDGSMKTLPIQCECRKAEDLLEAERARKIERMETIKRLKSSSLMDEKFADCTFDNVGINADNARQVKICRRYAEKFREMLLRNQGMLFYGPVGTGKTHLACCIGNELMSKLYSVHATSFIKILAQSKSFNGDEENLYIKRMNAADLLIIDDLGAERSTDYALEIVYNVIDSRYRTKKPMIVTTNLSIYDMRNTVDVRYKRIYDRIFEVCYPVEFTGKSWRTKEAGSRFNEMKELLEG